MTKRLMNSTTYRVLAGTPTTGIDAYAVTLTRIRNDVNGNPRFQADITNLDDLANNRNAMTARYTFTGHYMSEYDEAREIVRRHREAQQ